MEKEILAVLLTDTHLKESNIEINHSIFAQAVEFCHSNNITTIYHLGDIFDSRKAQTIDILVDGFLSILDYLQENNIQLVVVEGNHEKTDYSSTTSFLAPFKHHPALVLISDYFNCASIDPTVHFHFLPFFSNDIYRKELEMISSSLIPREGIRDILFTHIGISGAIMNNGMKVDGIKQDLFTPFESVLIGHYHDKQVFDKFIYIGSSIQHNYGETPDKGLTILYNDLTIETIELNFPRYLKIEVDINKLSLSDIEELRKQKIESGDNLRVVLIGKEKDIKSFNKQALLDIGLSVEMKTELVHREEISTRVESYTQSSLFIEFTNFCEKNKLKEAQGRKYLYKCLQTDEIINEPREVTESN